MIGVEAGGGARAVGLAPKGRASTSRTQPQVKWPIGSIEAAEAEYERQEQMARRSGEVAVRAASTSAAVDGRTELLDNG